MAGARLGRLGLLVAIALVAMSVTASPQTRAASREPSPPGEPSNYAGASAVTDAPAQQTTPVFGSPIASPEPVLASNGRRELAYELMLTNRSESTVTVRKVEALAGGKVVEKLSGKSLEAVMEPFGQFTTSDKLNPGESGFVMMDVSLARKAKIPAELTHRIVISMKPKPAFASALSYELAPTKVTFRKALVIHPPVYGPGWIINSGCCSAFNFHRGVAWPVNGAITVSERFAIDFFQVDATGNALDGPDDQLTSYVSYGAEVHSATAGKVISVRNDMPEAPLGPLPPGLTLEEGPGNKVVIDAGHGRYVFYAHLQHRSVTVHPGERVKVGQTLGLLGNSGNSAGAHLHFQVMNGPLSAGSNGMPFRFSEFNLQGTVTSFDSVTGLAAIDRAEHGIRRDVLPLDQQVVEFSG